MHPRPYRPGVFSFGGMIHRAVIGRPVRTVPSGLYITFQRCATACECPGCALHCGASVGAVRNRLSAFQIRCRTCPVETVIFDPSCPRRRASSRRFNVSQAAKRRPLDSCLRSNDGGFLQGMSNINEPKTDSRIRINRETVICDTGVRHRTWLKCYGCTNPFKSHTDNCARKRNIAMADVFTCRNFSLRA